MNEMMTWVPQFPYPGIFLLLVLGTLGLPFPEDAVLILTGFLAARGLIDKVPAFLIIYPTLLMTDFSLYWAGKKYGRKIAEHKRFRKLLSPGRLQKLEGQFRTWGALVIFFGRQLPGLRAQIFLVAGAVRCPRMKFFLADAASALITIVLIAGIGYTGAERLAIWKDTLSSIGPFLSLGLIAVLAIIVFFKHLKRGLR